MATSTGCAARACASARKRCSSGWTSATRANDLVETLSGGLRGASSWPRRCCISRSCCCSTSRAPGSTPRRGASSSTCLARLREQRRRHYRAHDALHGRGRALRPYRHPASGPPGRARPAGRAQAAGRRRRDRDQAGRRPRRCSARSPIGSRSSAALVDGDAPDRAAARTRTGARAGRRIRRRDRIGDRSASPRWRTSSCI